MRIHRDIVSDSQNVHTTLLYVIIFIAAFLRLNELTGFSLSNDELSALARLQYATAREVIINGVYPDFHPAGVQLFLYYWTKVFGFTEFMVRLPFALFGIGSVYLLYRIGRYWFSETTGLIAAAALAVLQYPVLYSQIARPYSPGLFFTLTAVFFWTRALFNKKKSENNKIAYWNFLGFALAVSCCMYTHYFSFIFAGILCFAGLFFLRKNTIVPYLLSGLLIAALYVPHLSVFFHQLSKGGVGGADGWLGPPGKDAFSKYINYCFNDSSQLKLLFFIITTGTILLFRKQIKLSLFHVLSVLFFALPFLIAYYYSLWKNPVFQHSVLLFSFPYLLLLLFSFIPEDAGNFTKRILVVVILAGGYYSTVHEKHYYQTAHFTEFRGIAKRIKQLDEKFSQNQITKTISVFSPYYINYYLEKSDHDTNFELTSVMTSEERKQFRKIVETAKTPYFLHAYSNVYDEPVFDMIIRSKFPWILLRDSMLNSGLRFYSKERSDTALNRIPVIDYQYGFESNEWQDENKFTDSLIKYEGNSSIHIRPDETYGPGLIKKVSDYGITSGSLIELNAVFFATQRIKHAKFVFTIENNGKPILWTASNFSDFSSSDTSWTRIFLSVVAPPEINDSSMVKIFCWNESNEEFHVDDFNLKIYSPR